MTQNAQPSSKGGPLSGIVVVDLSRILAGPYCTLLMAEMGAGVIKVEPTKGGDDARAYGPFVKGKSTYFASVNRGKESIALDLKADADRKIFEKLLQKADVIVENFRPGTMEKLGYGWDALHKKYPRLIYASASGFGHSGPNSKDPAYDMVVQGMGGIMSITGNEGQPPAPSSSPPATTVFSSRPARRSAGPRWRVTPTTKPTPCARSITAGSSARSRPCSRATRRRAGSPFSPRPACRAGRSTTSSRRW